MRLICHKCTNNNSYTIWKTYRDGFLEATITSNKLLCKQCGFSIANTIIIKIIGIVLQCSVIVISNLIVYKYLYVVKRDLLLSFPIAFALVFILMPVYVFLICFVNNCAYHIRQKRRIKKNL